jgi:hypothetical protein
MHPVQTLNKAWTALGFEPLPATDVPAFWRMALERWAERHRLRWSTAPGIGTIGVSRFV